MQFNGSLASNVQVPSHATRSTATRAHAASLIADQWRAARNATTREVDAAFLAARAAFTVSITAAIARVSRVEVDAEERAAAQPHAPMLTAKHANAPKTAFFIRASSCALSSSLVVGQSNHDAIIPWRRDRAKNCFLLIFRQVIDDRITRNQVAERAREGRKKTFRLHDRSVGYARFQNVIRLPNGSAIVISRTPQG